MLEYEDKSNLIPKDKYLFSCTQYYKFWSNPKEFFRNVLLKEREFNYTNNTVLGTLIHYLIECKHKHTECSYIEIEKYLSNLDYLIIDKDYIRNKFNEMKEYVLSIIEGDELNDPLEVEKNYIFQLSENVYLGGTIDAYYDNKIVDYKTCSILPTEMSMSYKVQLMLYKFLIQSNAHTNITQLRNTYFSVPNVNRYSEKTGKRLKDYPCERLHLDIFVEDNDSEYQLLQDNLYMIADCIEYILKHPDTLYLFSKDITLKGVEWQSKS